MERPPEINLPAGQIWTNVQKITNASPYAVRTPVATAIARGTEFGVKLFRSTNAPSQTPNPKSEVRNPKERQRVRGWKWELQNQLVDPFGLTVTVCHYPTGASKWNPIEHRLFGRISQHWAGQPLDSFATILRSLRQTTTLTGLRVTSYLVSRFFPVGQKISTAQMRLLSLTPRSVLPAWNYTLHPRRNRK